mgnify:CR=1 FL=1
MAVTRKRSIVPTPDETGTTTTDSADVDSVEEQPRNHLQGRSGLSPLSVPRSSTSPDLDNVRVWPLCFAIAIEKSRRVRPAIMVSASSLLAGVTYHLQESDAELMVRFSYTF